METKNKEAIRGEYILRINAVQDYVEENLNKTFVLEELAEVAGFSKFHFHKIFSSIVGETAYNFINRIRLEKAVAYLLSFPEKSVTDVAMALGYSDSAVFARSFKRHYGISASEYRDKHSKNGNEKSYINTYNHANTINKWRHENMQNKVKVTIENLPDTAVIYLRHAGSYSELGKVFHEMIGKLYSWGMEHNALVENETKLLAIYHDNPEITEDDKRRTSIGITVADKITPDGEFSKLIIKKGKYAVGHFEIDDEVAAQEHSAAWGYMFGQWLAESKNKPDDKPAFEVYANDPNTHPERKHLVDIYVPIK